jgi:hypothetical protein
MATTVLKVVIVEPEIILFFIFKVEVLLFPLFVYFVLLFPFVLIHKTAGLRIGVAPIVWVNFDCGCSAISIVEEHTINIMAANPRHSQDPP